MAKADIEDLFTPGEYLGFYNATFGTSLNHGAVAAQFLRTLDASIKSLSAGTLDRFEKLIIAINNAFPRI